MKKSELIFGLLIVSLVVLIGVANASYNFVNASIGNSYSQGDQITGWFNISFANQTNANFTTNFGGSLDALSFLKRMNYSQGNNYTCSPGNCQDGYGITNSSTSKTISSGGKLTFSFGLENEQDVGISTLRFHIKSDAAPSCINPFYLDLLNDGNVDIFDNNYVDSPCSTKNYGCFSDGSGSISTTQVAIPSASAYCEKIVLRDAPAYRIGAKVINGSVTGNITMSLFNIDVNTNDQVASCSLPALTQNNQELDCIANYSSNKKFNAYVCISADSGTDYKIRSETTSTCGMEGVNPQSNFTRDYEIFSYPLTYGKVDGYFDESSYGALNNGNSLADLLNNYITTKYSNSCSPNCILPFTLSVVTPNVIIDDISLNYTAAGASGGITNNKIYDISTSSFTISSGNLIFDMAKLNAYAPNSTGATNFVLSFNNDVIYSKSINITAISGGNLDINPKFALIGQNTLFTVNSSGRLNITSTLWRFGDGTDSVSSNDNTAIHRYDEAGDYNLTVTLNYRDGTSVQKSTKINVGNAKDSAGYLITDYTNRINNISKQLTTFPAWIKSQISSQINLTQLNSSLRSAIVVYNNASTDSDYSKVVTSLIALDIPYSIADSKVGNNVPLEIGLANIDTSFIEDLSNTTVASDQEQKLKDNLGSWMQSNYRTNVNYEVISKYSDTGSVPILSRFTLTISPSSSNSSSGYLIIPFSRNTILFSTNYNTGDVKNGAGTSIPVNGAQTVDFALPGSVDITELGAYISPPVSELGTYTGTIEPVTIPKFRTAAFWILIGILLVVFLIIYILIQEWYKKNYESHLFKNKNDVYNLVNFIYNSRLKGMNDEEIKKKLLEAGWKKEQISYALRKIDGKRTGMWEIPLFRHSENKKLTKEIESRHPEGIDRRFINR